MASRAPLSTVIEWEGIPSDSNSAAAKATSARRYGSSPYRRGAAPITVKAVSSGGNRAGSGLPVARSTVPDGMAGAADAEGVGGREAIRVPRRP